MALDPESLRLFRLIVAGLPGHPGEVISMSELEYMALIVARMPFPFKHETRDDRQLVLIAGQGGAFAVMLAKHGGRAWLVQFINSQPMNLYSFPSVAMALISFETSILETMPAPFSLRPASATLH